MIAYIPAAVCGILSAALIRSGLPSFFFLVPMGFMAYGYGPASARTSAGIAVLGNGVVSLGTSLFLGRAFSWTDTLYFTLMLSVYTCILAPPVRRIGPFPLTLPYRLIGGSFIGALLFLLVMETTQGSFGEFLLAQGKLLSSIYIASAGTDVVQRSILEQYVTPERVAEVLAAVLLRGGGFASCLLVFLASRQISLLAVRLIRRVGTPEQISRFHTPSQLIWVLSFSLCGILLAKAASLTFLEIPVWNLLSICGALYFAQGWGILRHFLTRPERSPWLRLGLNIAIITALFSPGVNIIFLGLVILLGIAEHWAPLRAPKSDGPSSTPGM